jgi:hypothetical protein
MSTVNSLSVSAALPHDARTATRRIAQHVEAEYGNQVPVIMPTVSTWDIHFAMPAPAPAGIDLMLATTTDEARTYYEGTRREWSIVTSHHLKTVDAPWYSLHDSVGELRMLATGEVRIGRTAVLFPAWTDGIIGEIVWAQQPWAAADGRNLTDAELATMRLHDDYVARWKDGDVDGLLDLVDDDCCTVVRIAGVAGVARSLSVAKSKHELRAQLASPGAGRIVDFELTNHVMSHWYAFAAYRMVVQLADRRVEREIAALYPIAESGRIVGQLAYGFEVDL